MDVTKVSHWTCGPGGKNCLYYDPVNGCWKDRSDPSECPDYYDAASDEIEEADD